MLVDHTHRVSSNRKTSHGILHIIKNMNKAFLHYTYKVNVLPVYMYVCEWLFLKVTYRIKSAIRIKYTIIYVACLIDYMVSYTIIYVGFGTIGIVSITKTALYQSSSIAIVGAGHPLPWLGYFMKPRYVQLSPSSISPTRPCGIISDQ